MAIAATPTLKPARESGRSETAFALGSSDARRRPWEVARWGRLLAGSMVLLFTALGLLHHPYWLAANLGIALNLVMTSITDKCLFRDLLLRLGAREREDLFLPGGAPRPEVGARVSSPLVVKRPGWPCSMQSFSDGH